MTPMVERGYKDCEEGKTPNIGRQVDSSDEVKLDAPHAVPKEDFASRSPAKKEVDTVRAHPATAQVQF